MSICGKVTVTFTGYAYGTYCYGLPGLDNTAPFIIRNGGQQTVEGTVGANEVKLTDQGPPSSAELESCQPHEGECQNS